MTRVVTMIDAEHSGADGLDTVLNFAGAIQCVILRDGALRISAMFR